MSTRIRNVAGLALLCTGLGIALWYTLHAPNPSGTSESAEASTTTHNPTPDAGEGARNIEALPIETLDTPQVFNLLEASPAEATEQRAEPQADARAAAEEARRPQEQEVLRLLGTRGESGFPEGEFGSTSMNAGVSGQAVALGVETGSGGLGSRGSGLGSGGSAAGLRGLGTKGLGAGRSGYGSGGGTFRAWSQGAVSSETYTDYGINNVTLVSEDAQSTFGVDVDTASFTIARRKLTDGLLPPEASVRVEEFVNYFDYNYATPSKAPFSVHMEAAPSPWSPQKHILRVGIQGRSLDEDSRPPARLTFLVDVSGSMSRRDKLPLAQRAMRELVSNLGPEDSVAIATYAGRTAQVLAPTAALDKAIIFNAIEELSAGGGTGMSSGVELAYRMADAAYVEGAENRVLILSDGDANIGPSSHQEILAQIEQHAGRGISLSTIGFGMGNYNDTMMEQLANKGDGNNFTIDSFNEARRIFGEDLSGTIQTIARDVKIQVEFDPQAVYAYRLIGYENRDIADRDFRNDAIDAGEVGSGHQVTALYELTLDDGYRQAGTLATVRLRAKPPGPDAPAEEWNTAFPAGHVKLETAETSNDFRFALGAAAFAEKLRNSPHVAELSYTEIIALLQGNAATAELRNLITTAHRLEGLEAISGL